MAANDDLFHRKSSGYLGGNTWSSWKVAGKVHRVGRAAYFIVKYEWDQSWGADDDGRAPVRAYKLATGEGRYGSLFLYAWMLTYDMLSRIPKFDEVVPADVLSIMRANPNILVETQWTVSDGFEAVVSVLPYINRVVNGTIVAPGDRGRVPGPSYGLIGRVDIKLVKQGGSVSRPKEVIGWSPWPAATRLQDFVPPAITAAALKYPTIEAWAADDPPPDIDEPLAGGAHFKDGEILLKHSSKQRVICYAYQNPNQDYIEYVRLTGDLTADPLTGQRMFDERALLEIATDPATLAELNRVRARRQWLDSVYLLPGKNGIFPVEVPKAWLVEQTASFPPGLSLSAKWLCGVNSYFTFELVVEAAGRLRASTPISMYEEEPLAVQLSITPQRREVAKFHMILQSLLDEKVRYEKRTEPFDLALGVVPFETFIAIVAYCAVPGCAHELDAAVVDYLLDDASLDKLVGHTVASLSATKSQKKPDFYMIHPGKRLPAKKRSLNQPMGSLRRNSATGHVTLRISVGYFKGRTLTQGSVPQPFPDTDPPDGGLWVYSLRLRDWVPKAQERTAKRALSSLYPVPPRWAQYPVDA